MARFHSSKAEKCRLICSEQQRYLCSRTLNRATYRVFRKTETGKKHSVIWNNTNCELCMLSLQNSGINHLFAEIHRDCNFMLCNTKWSVFAPSPTRSTARCSFPLDWNSTQALIHSHVRINSKLYTDYCRIVRCKFFSPWRRQLNDRFQAISIVLQQTKTFFSLWLLYFAALCAFPCHFSVCKASNWAYFWLLLFFIY